MTLAMLLVLISHHKGLTLLLIVIIALLFIALTRWSKTVESPSRSFLNFLYDRLQGAFSSSSPFIRHPLPSIQFVATPEK